MQLQLKVIIKGNRIKAAAVNNNVMQWQLFACKRSWCRQLYWPPDLSPTPEPRPKYNNSKYREMRKCFWGHTIFAKYRLNLYTVTSYAYIPN